MNAAFLLLTSACFAGQAPPAKAMAAPPAQAVSPGPITSTVVPGGCDSCGGCATCDGGCGHGHGHKLFGGFGRHHASSCDSCGTPSCGHGHGHRTWTAPASCGCDACDTGCGHGHGHGGGMFGRFFGGHHKSCGCECDGGCGTPGCANGSCAPSVAPYPAGTPAPKTGGEILTAPPKKMPPPPTPAPTPAPAPAPAPKISPAPQQSSAIIPAPAAISPAPSIEVVPPAPSVVVPNVSNGARSPF